MAGALGLGLGGWAQAQTVVPPQEAIRDIVPDAAPTLAPRLQGPRITATPIAPGAPDVRVASVAITGNTALSEAELSSLYAGLAGRMAAQSEIEEARIAVLAAYRNAGFPFVSVVVTGDPTPAGFALRFAVQEGRIARVRLAGEIGPAATQVLRFLERAVTEGPTPVSRIERALLLAGDVPGVTVRGVLRPLADGAPGELELVAELSRRAYSGLVTVDNRAFERTGPVQFLGLVQGNSFTSWGERIEAVLFASASGETIFGQATGEFFVGSSGLRVRLYAGAGRTAPSGPFAGINYQGFTTVAGIGAAYPIIRARSMNLMASVQFDITETTVETGRNPARPTSADSLRVLRLGLEGQRLDTLLGFAPAAATMRASIRLHQGLPILGARSRGGALPGPARRGSDFAFTRLTGEIQRTQPLARLGTIGLFSLQGTVAGQWSNDVLPASEKFFLGGSRLGRGFYSGQVSGDRAVIMALEAQIDLNLPAFTLPGPPGEARLNVRPAAQLYAFYDAGRTWENLRTDPNRRIESWGGGVRTVFNDVLHLDAEVAHRLTRRVDGAGVRPLGETVGYFRAMVRF